MTWLPIQPKEILVDIDDCQKTFIISKFPAIAGREIVAKYPLSGLPKLGDYSVNEETMIKLMSYVSVITEAGTTIRLVTRALIDNHVPSWEMLANIEMQMLEYNVSFFRNGRISTFFADIAQKVPAWITKILMDSSGSSLPKEKQH